MKTKTNFLATATFLTAFIDGFCQPTITKQPTNQSVSLGASAKFQVTAASTSPPILFQWRFATTNVPNATNSSLALTNIQITTAGDYDAILTDSSGSVTSQVAHLEVDPTFTKITTGNIVTDVGTGQAGAWGDYDNDGLIDLFVTSAINSVSNTAQKNILYHNNGNGTFTKITNSIVVSEARDWRGCAWADYDNDGNLDLIVTSTDADGFLAQNELFRNNGDGTLTKMTPNNAGSIVSLAAGGSEGCAWADYDNDGFLDLFVARYGPDWLSHNNGDGTFLRMTNSIPPDNQASYGAMWGDYDNDGWPDLFVTVAVGSNNFLYHNRGDGTFTKILTGPVATDKAGSFGCAWADYDNDGNLDLFVANYDTNNLLYHNDGDGTFTKMTSNAVGTIVGDVAPFLSCAWADYDNDGFLDLFVTQDQGANFLYHNNGDGTFTRVLSGSLVNDKGVSGSCAWGDYDNDGFLDLFVARPGDRGLDTNLLYRNNGNSNAWIKIKLQGTLSNRSAIGAKVRVMATIRGRPFWQMREISPGSYFGTGSLDPHFGLGDATNIDLVRIEWPSGIVQTFTNVPPRQALTITEHQGNATEPPVFSGLKRLTNGAIRLSASGTQGARYLFEASTDLVSWTKIGIRTNLNGSVEFLDSSAPKFNQRFYRVSAP